MKDRNGLFQCKLRRKQRHQEEEGGVGIPGRDFSAIVCMLKSGW